MNERMFQISRKNVKRLQGATRMKKDITIIGVPMDLGQMRRGVDMGPSAIRYAGVIEVLEELGFRVWDLGDIPITRNKVQTDVQTGIKNLEEVVRASKVLADKIKTIMKKDCFPLIFGGDHSISIGTLAGISPFYSNLGVIWFDAHGDLNTPETSPSGNIHGMPLAASLGKGDERLTKIGGFTPKVQWEHVVMIGIRSLDDGEKRLIKKKNIKVYTMHDIDRLGMAQIIEETIEYFKSKKVDGVHLSFDLDALDPIYAPGVGTPEAGGVTYRESHLAMEMLAEANIITSAEFVEVNPILDERNKTAEVAVDLMGSLFGKSIL